MPIGPTSARGAAGLCGAIALLIGLSAEALAQDDALPDSGDVTYDQVLESPDDIMLSYRFALKQIGDGDLLGASATLDRLTLLAPQEPNIRALRAIVLYRLGNLREAKNEFEDLLKLDIDPQLRTNIERYAQAIDRQSQDTRVNLLLSLGMQFDSNRAGGNNVNRWPDCRSSMTCRARTATCCSATSRSMTATRSSSTISTPRPWARRPASGWRSVIFS